MAFIANHLGNIEIEMNNEEEGFVFKNFNISEIAKDRQSWGNIRDRRPDPVSYTHLTLPTILLV